MNAIRPWAAIGLLLVTTPAAARREAVREINPTPLAVSEDWRCSAEGGQVTCGSGDPRSPETAGYEGTVGERITAGPGHACAVSGGTMRCWGDNEVGQLGGGEAGPRSAVVEVPLTGVRDASAGGDHTCAVTDDGRVWCWGENANGQLGHGGFADSAVPGRVVGVSRAVEVRAGRDFSCALRDSGDVWCWGADIAGRAGAGAIRTAPEAMTDGVIAMDAGFGMACAVRSGGEVLCWGRFPVGTAARPREVAPVPGVGDAISVAIGYDHACALRTDGTVACWGNGEFGRLGHGTCDSSDAPVVVEGLAGVTALDASATHTCATTPEGVYCWGGNWTGTPPAHGEPAPCDPEVARAMKLAPNATEASADTTAP